MTERYPYIRAWGKMLGSFDYYIDVQKSKAEQLRAPQNTIYIMPETDESAPVISTTDDILAPSVRDRFAKFCQSLGIESPWANLHF